MAKQSKTPVEVSLVKLVLTGVPEKRLIKSRHLGTVDLIWPKVGTAKKSASRQMDLRLGKADFTGEPWAKRVLFREEIEGKCGIAVSLTDTLTIQKIRKYLKLVAKYALKEGSDIVAASVAGYGDIASAPVDALVAMVGPSDAPKTIAQGVIDFTELPAEGEVKTVDVPLQRPLTGASIGVLTLAVEAHG